MPIRKERLTEIRLETEKDDTLQTLKYMILKGLLDDPNDIPLLIKSYSNSKDEDSVQDELIFKGNRIVIPLNLRNDIKKVIHSSHIDIEGCCRRAREYIF